MEHIIPDFKYPVQPYAEWPSEDEHRRWLRAGNAFDAHLMAGARDSAREQIPPDASPETKALAEELIDHCLCGVMSLLDGYEPTPIDKEHFAVYALLARICKNNMDDVVETIELAPDGDGLQMGYWGWKEGDFG